MSDLANLAPNVAIVTIFIWYLNKKDKIISQALKEQGKIVQKALREFSHHMNKLANAIQALEKRLESVEGKRMK